ncbi:class E sortase [Pseudarthrobacter sp. NamE2]|uniref:class E sortase n=1 Tax=Pseudarthrobacter sp. NamE2 TaxID=2576838 RepID=UPI0010FE060C|nr:class E sortase [Pseudarthrobacter sp. NamE2]TLM83863.1 class E sortase [Pseudarthrobacter sp. NamE2]
MVLQEKARPAASRAAGVGILRGTIQVLGELLITGGIILLLFVAWQLWWTNVESDARQSEVIKEFAQDLGSAAPAAPAEAAPAPTGDFGEPVVGSAPGHAGTIGIMYIPRFGPNYTRPIVQGTTSDVLDTLGLGHYANTAMPGAVGNFAVAGHRQTHGAVLDNIHTLVPGDKIYVQTKDGYYVYVFRNNQIVMPDRTDVLEPVPTLPGVTPTERFLTMTSCNPRFGAEERIIAYALLDSWRPASAGPPEEIAAQVAAATGRD